MKTTYLLPCPCGEKTQIDASESGREVKCRCGASLAVPTLRGLARLEKVEVEGPPASAGAWGGVQRSMAVGALIAVVGIGMSIYWTVKPLPRPQDVFKPDDLAQLGIPRDYKPDGDKVPLSPVQTIYLWGVIEAEGLMAPQPQKLEPYHRALDVVVWWRVVSYAVAALGLIVLGASLAVFWISRSQHAPLPLGTAAS